MGVYLDGNFGNAAYNLRRFFCDLQFAALKLAAQECVDTFASCFITLAVESTEVPIAYAAATGTIIKDYHCPDNAPSFSPNQTAALRIEITLLLETFIASDVVLR